MAVTTQPLSKRAQLEALVGELDPLQVLEWTPQEVVDKFLVLLSMENMAKAFIEHQISGAVLLALTEEHMKELTCAVLGQRVLFLEYLAVLKRHKRDADRSKTLWSVTTPEWGKQSHHHRCTGFCFQFCFPCCVGTREWRVTGQGIRWRRNRAAIDCCGDVETQFIDYRFLKDLELRKEPKCLCCCVAHELVIYADDKDTISGHRTTTPLIRAEAPPITIVHPDVGRAESIIRNAWADVRLVAD
ncbi:hypothetical protein EMCRGX_G023712 [Ephydatia muelleri]